MSGIQNNDNVSKYTKLKCAFCGKPMNFATTQEIDYDLRESDNRVWCGQCNKYTKFSVKKK